jgi:3-dehydroquinate dehydratase I
VRNEALKSDSNRVIRIIASLSSPREFQSPLIHEADALEVRLDMITEPIGDALHQLRTSFTGPIILTLRSSDEGGAYAGGTEGFLDRIVPYLSEVDMVDLEIRFSNHVKAVKQKNKTVIGSCHQNNMPEKEELHELIQTLHQFGDIIKIAVQPQSDKDLLFLLQTSLTCPYPLIMSVTGTIYRYARPLLCLFGSLYTYCYIGSATSPGQYSIKEMQLLAHLLSPGFVDPWFEGRPIRSGDVSGFERP